MSAQATDHRGAAPQLCYLCGQPLSDPISRDHVPPKQLYAHEVRKTHPTNLLTIPVHAACNKAYQHDEDYFAHTLMPFARGSYAGDAFYKETIDKFHAKKNVRLAMKVLKEFERQPSGLVLPGGKVAKRFEGKRVSRVAWKIVRGLYFHHHGELLPIEGTSLVSVTAPGEMPPEHFLLFTGLADNPGRGQYPSVFDYRFQKFPDANDLHYWAMLLWDRIIVIVLFHDPHCACAECRPAAATHSTASSPA